MHISACMILYAVYIQPDTYAYGLKYLYVCEAHTAHIRPTICTRYKAIHIAYARTVLDTYIPYLYVSDCIPTVFLFISDCISTVFLFISDCIWLYLTVFCENIHTHMVHIQVYCAESAAPAGAI